MQIYQHRHRRRPLNEKLPVVAYRQTSNRWRFNTECCRLKYQWQSNYSDWNICKMTKMRGRLEMNKLKNGLDPERKWQLVLLQHCQVSKLKMIFSFEYINCYHDIIMIPWHFEHKNIEASSTVSCQKWNISGEKKKIENSVVLKHKCEELHNSC